MLQLLNLIKHEKKLQQQQLCTLQNAIEFRSRIEFEFHFSKASTAELGEKTPFYWLNHLIFCILKTTKTSAKCFFFVLLFIHQRRRRVNEVKERGQRTFRATFCGNARWTRCEGKEREAFWCAKISQKIVLRARNLNAAENEREILKASPDLFRQCQSGL